MPFSRTEPNVPEWEEDPNSPFTFSPQSSLTASFADNYQIVRVHYSVTNETNNAASLDCRVQGVTTSDYTTLRRAGNKITGVNDIRRVDSIFPGETVNGVLAVDNKDGGVTVAPLTGQPIDSVAGAQPAVGILAGTGGPVSQITLKSSNDISGTIEVYGRDIG